MADANGTSNEETEPKTNREEAEGDIVVGPLTGDIACGTVGRVGTVVDGVDPATGDHAIAVNAADGARSTSRLKEDGSVSLDIEGAAAVGRRGEPRAIRTLRQRLQADGHVVSVGPGEDDRGEDGILTVDGLNYELQLVTTPGISTFWQQARIGSSTSEADATGAVEWVRTAIEAKAHKRPLSQRPRTVLALDAQHAGVLAVDRVTDAYLKRFRPPEAEFGFAAVWVVGPTVQRCVRV